MTHSGPFKNPKYFLQNDQLMKFETKQPTALVLLPIRRRRPDRLLIEIPAQSTSVQLNWSGRQRNRGNNILRARVSPLLSKEQQHE